MTIHQVATLLDSMRSGLDGVIKSDVSNDFKAISEAFRDLPDQSVRDFVKNVKAKPATAGKKIPISIPDIIEQIRSLRAGTGNRDAIQPVIEKLTDTHLKTILKEFQVQPAKGKVNNLSRVLALFGDQQNGTHETGGETKAKEFDSAAVERAVALYNRLIDNRSISFEQLRGEFDSIRGLAKREIEEVSRNLGYTPFGSKEEILERLLNHLEGIKLSQLKGDWIASGK